MGGISKRLMGAAALLATVATACDPPPPPRTFVVNTTEFSYDLDPGDGVCEATEGLGDCSIVAAFAEADSGPDPAVVELPPSDTPYPYLNWDVVNDITLRVQGGPVELEGVWLWVGPAARLSVEGLDLGSGRISVSGQFVANRVAVRSGASPVVSVDEGGTAIVVNSFLGNDRYGAFATVENAGSLILSQSTVAGGYAWTLVTEESATTHLVGSALLRSDDYEEVVVCAGDGTLTSGGYNVTADATCGLSGVGDVVGDVTPADGEPFPPVTSPRVDAIPVGELGCGTTLVTDIRGSIRPTDGDGDGTPACDIGAWER